MFRQENLGFPPGSRTAPWSSPAQGLPYMLHFQRGELELSWLQNDSNSQPPLAKTWQEHSYALLGTFPYWYATVLLQRLPIHPMTQSYLSRFGHSSIYFKLIKNISLGCFFNKLNHQTQDSIIYYCLFFFCFLLNQIMMQLLYL